MNAIALRDLHCGYGARPVIRGLSLAVPGGDFLGILGPNGSGKTTLLRAVTGILRPESGDLSLNGTDVRALPPRAVARQVACVAQENAIPASSGNLAFMVRDIVAMGRTPYLARTGWERAADREAVGRAMELAGVAELADRSIAELSGGERQRAFIGMALAQECGIVLLDEPTSHLDIAHQVAILDLFARLNRQSGTTVVGVFHDLNLAAEYCARILLLKDGRAAALGSPADVLTAEHVEAVYGTPVTVRTNPATQRPHVFLRGHAADVP